MTQAKAAFAVRRMRLEDLEEVLAVEKAAFQHPWSGDLFTKELEHEWSTILIAQEPARSGAGARIVGFLIYWLVHDEVHILNVATAPAERRRGVARALLAEACQRATAADCALLTLEVRRSNTGALALYQQLGYQQVGVRTGYYAAENEDAIVMTLTLRDRGF